MRNILRISIVMVAISFASFFIIRPSLNSSVLAQTAAVPSATPLPSFDQAAALAKLREQIKGKEKDPASNVFKNIQMLKQVPAGRLLSIMENGYSRSLGVDCTHCHVSAKWESEDKPEKQIARDMAGMVGRINGELLKGIKNLKNASPTINCTTCHRGEVKPALNLTPAKG
jgi:hypothetical protein